MAGHKQNPLIVPGLILIIVLALISIVNTALPKTNPRLVGDWTCENCEYKFIAPSGREPTACPKCGKEAVRTYYFYCSAHDHIFDGYRHKLIIEAQTSPQQGTGPTYSASRFYKMPGGDWTSKFPAVITCPQGTSDHKKVAYCPPESEKRRSD